MARVPLNDDVDDDEDRDDSVDEPVEPEPRPKKSKKAPAPRAKEPEPPKRRRRWPWILAMLVAGVAFAPTIVAKTPARNWILKAAVPKFPGRMTIDRADLAWWSPPVLEGIVVTDADGEDLLTVARISGNRAPWEIAREPSKLGVFRVEKPVVTLSTRPGGSNLEEAIEKLGSSSKKNSKSAPFEFKVEVVDGKVEIVSDEVSERATIDAIAVTIDSSGDAEAGVRIQAQADVLQEEADPGRITVDATLTAAESDDADAPPPIADRVDPRRPPAEDEEPLNPSPPRRRAAPAKHAAASSNVQMLRGVARVDQVQLESLRPLWKRLEKTTELGGLLTADLKFRGRMAGDDPASSVGVGGTASVDQFRCQADSWLRGDRLRLAKIKWTGTVDMDGRTISADRVVLSSDPARIEAHGTFPRLQPADLDSWEQTGKTLASENFTLRADADLAQIAALAPRALRLRDDTEITAGRANMTLQSLEENGERVLSADLQTTDLAGRTPQGAFVWREPLQGALAARMGTEGPVVDRLACRASFLELAGSGTPRDARVLAKCDLNRFTADAGRVLDLRDFQLGGRVTVDADCKQEAEDRLTAKGRIFLEDFIWAAPGRDALREKQLTATFAANAGMKDATITRVSTAKVLMTGTSDELSVELARPVMLDEVRRGQGEIPLRAALNGPLSLWHQRLMPWVGLETWRFDGQADLSTNIVWTCTETRLSQIQGTVRQLVARGEGFQLDEPWVQITGDAGWNATERKLTSDDLVVNGSTISLRTEEFSVAMPTGAAPSLAGTLSFRGDLDKLRSVRPAAASLNGGALNAGAAAAPPAFELKGIAAGKIRAVKNGDTTTADGEVRIKDCVLVRTGAAPQPAAAAPARVPVFLGGGGGASATNATATRAPGTGENEEWPLGEVVITGQGDFLQKADSLTLKSFKVASDPLQLEARGTVSHFADTPVADVQGAATYDWRQLQGWITQLAGDGFRLEGRQSDTFSYKGPLAFDQPATGKSIPAANVSFNADRDAAPSTAIRDEGRGPSPWDQALGQAKTGWEKAEIYGLGAGPAQFNIRVAEGLARVEGMDLDVAGGRVTAKPVVVLNEGPATLQHGKGRIVENVRLSPELCRQWVKYVAPLLADATQIDGKFSLDLNGARVPISDPTTGDVGGVLTVPHADVRPGPFADQIIQTVRQIEVLLRKRSPDRVGRSNDAVLTLDNQSIEFRMLDGRVHHRGLELLVGEDVTVRTRGSVGLDDTIDIVAEIPVRDEWVRRDKTLASLQGQTLQIPMRGTLKRPQVDPNVFADLTKRLATGSITKGIEDELSNQLDRLFRRKK